MKRPPNQRPKANQSRLWYTKRRQQWREPRKGLRPVERYGQDVVGRQITPPRQVNLWHLVGTQLSGRALLIMLFYTIIAGLLGYAQLNWPTPRAPNARFVLFLILGLLAMASVMHEQILGPWYHWWRALKHGTYAIAQVTIVARRMVYYRDVVEGRWEFARADGPHEITFRLYNDECGAWVRRLTPGCQVHVLLHPTKPKVLLALGLVEKESPPLRPSDPSHFLRALLSTSMPEE